MVSAAWMTTCWMKYCPTLGTGVNTLVNNKDHLTFSCSTPTFLFQFIYLFSTSLPNWTEMVPPPPWAHPQNVLKYNPCREKLQRHHHTIHKCKFIHDEAFVWNLPSHTAPCTAPSATPSLQAAFWSWCHISIFHNVARSLCSSAFPSPLAGGQHAEDSQVTYLAVQHQRKLQRPF